MTKSATLFGVHASGFNTLRPTSYERSGAGLRGSVSIDFHLGPLLCGHWSRRSREPGSGCDACGTGLRNHQGSLRFACLQHWLPPPRRVAKMICTIDQLPADAPISASAPDGARSNTTHTEYHFHPSKIRMDQLEEAAQCAWLVAQ